MKADRAIKLLLCVIALLLLLNLASSFQSKPAMAAGEIGRYQISAWAAQSGTYMHHSGYYVVDTTTGKVVASESEVHGPEK
jgi:hypothetical protein